MPHTTTLDTPPATPVAFDAEPHTEAMFVGETMTFVAGVCLSLNVLDLVPDELAPEFWGRFWDGLADEIEQRLAAAMADPALFAAAQAAADAVFAATFARESRRLPAA